MALPAATTTASQGTTRHTTCRTHVCSMPRWASRLQTQVGSRQAVAAAKAGPGALVVRAATAQVARAGKARGNPLPEPQPTQQTLRRSFTIGGVGLHTGEFAVVRVMPAFAGEGRYFVRVPKGTNEHMWDVEQPEARELEEIGSEGSYADMESGAANAKLFFEFIKSQETEGYAGTFAEYFQQRAAAQPEMLLMDAEAELLPEEEPSAGEEGEARVPASAGSLRQEGPRWCSVLERGGEEVWGAEHLLAALECCGVDNARIEIEGGKEIPIVDGSALGWAVEVQRAGLRAAPTPAAADAQAAKSVPAPQEVVTVSDGEAFITFYPGPSARISVGVDHSAEAAVVGRQWFSWSPEDPGYHQGEHFRSALAPARTVIPSWKAVQAMQEEGMLQGGTEYVCLIGDGDEWEDPSMERFSGDEAARHACVDLLGDLSLLAQDGGRGLPAGHVVAYRPTHALHAAFVQQMAQAAEAAAAR